MRRTLLLVLVASMALAACEGARNNTSWSGKSDSTGVVPDLQKTGSSEAATMDSTAADTGSAATDTSQSRPQCSMWTLSGSSTS